MGVSVGPFGGSWSREPCGGCEAAPHLQLFQTYLVWNGSGTPWEQPSWLDLDLRLSGLGQVRTPEETAALCSLFWMKLTAGVAGTWAATWELGEDAAGTHTSPGCGWGTSHRGQARGFWEQTVFTQVTAPLSPHPVQLFFFSPNVGMFLRDSARLLQVLCKLC